MVMIRTYDFHRVNLNVLGFSTTYKTAGTAKIRGSRTRHRILWVGLWVGIFTVGLLPKAGLSPLL
jgi:hypothetical protein